MKNFAFTMAEILISLTIIGVIAAITLPSLRANINESAWATQRKALYSRISQAISMLPSLNGYGEYAGTWEDDVVTVTKDTAAAKFVTDGLAKVLNINNICTIPFNMSSENTRKELEKCGIPEKITNMANSKMYFPTNLTELNPTFTSTTQGYKNPQKHINTNAAAFETKNGEKIAVFYNPYCMADTNETSWRQIQPTMCANFIYDLNGQKGPNKVGKDIGFITALYPTDSEVVAPEPLEKNTNNGNGIWQTRAAAACRAQNMNSRLPNKNELLAMSVNMNFLNMSGYFWSSTVLQSNVIWLQLINLGRGGGSAPNNGFFVRCIKR